MSTTPTNNQRQAEIERLRQELLRRIILSESRRQKPAK
jgi:hypothetical protein